MGPDATKIVLPPPPQSKAELLERIHQYHAALSQMLRQLTPAQIVARRTADSWSAKDILAHIAMWETVLLRFHLQQQPFDVAVGIDGVQFGVTSEDVLNEHIYRRFRDWPWEDVLTFFETSHRQLLEALAALPEAELFALQGPVGAAAAQPLMNYVLWNTYEHFIEHMAMMRRVVEPL